MAEAEPNPQRPQKPKLKYLGFVVVLVLHLYMLVAKLYGLLKENLGPLKPGINAVENTVRSFAGPIWGKYENVPIECLKFVDREIDRCVKRMQRRVPKALKRVSQRAFKNAKKTPVAARSVMSDVQDAGMVETASYLAKAVAKDIYNKCKPIVEQHVSSAWHFLNQYTLVHRVVQNFRPIASQFEFAKADEQKLKYLGFVVVLILHLYILVVKLYSLLKENLGPLKPGINSVEKTVRSYAGPIWGKYDNAPIECLKFVDRKIDRCVKRMQRRVPKALKRVSRRAFKNAKKAPVAASSVMSDVQDAGMVETASYLAKSVAKDIYNKFKPIAEQHVSSAWHFLNQYTLVHRAVQNFASHLPLVLTEKMAKVLDDGNVEPVAEVSREEAVATK